MAGNSQRRGAMRKPGTKKGPVVGSGGQARRGLRGKGPTPPAENRTGHPARRAVSRDAGGAVKSSAKGSGKGTGTGSGKQGSGGTTGRGGRGSRGPAALPETVVGRNPVVEALRAGVPATALYVASGLATDERVSEAVAAVAERGIALLEVSRPELDRLTGNAVHQGLALTVPPYQYAHPEDLLARAADSGRAALIVAVDGVTDPRNLGAIVRSAAAFGAHGVVVPERRSAGMTASAWRTSAGTAARIRVARCTNLVRTLKEYAAKGLMIAGLDADGTVDTDDFELATSPLVLVVGSEGRGLSRLTRTVCDVTVSIPMVRAVESLNASVATGVVLAEVARRRRAG
ncbi:MAG TPA: 23S rRNA (guanosine(2251)-2'-O)-methyltransferase RlmB [Nakamurella sp.]